MFSGNSSPTRSSPTRIPHSPTRFPFDPPISPPSVPSSPPPKPSFSIFLPSAYNLQRSVFHLEKNLSLAFDQSFWPQLYLDDSEQATVSKTKPLMLTSYHTPHLYFLRAPHISKCSTICPATQVKNLGVILHLSFPFIPTCLADPNWSFYHQNISSFWRFLSIFSATSLDKTTLPLAWMSQQLPMFPRFNSFLLWSILEEANLNMSLP